MQESCTNIKKFLKNPAKRFFVEEEFDEDPFGHSRAGMDRPDADEQQGLFELGESVRPSELAAEHGHNWSWTGGSWQCTECLRSTRCRQRGGRQQRSGLPAPMKVAVHQASRRKHVLACARDCTNSFILWCVKCGGWGSNRTNKLTGLCVEPTRQGKPVLSRIGRQLHPDG